MYAVATGYEILPNGSPPPTNPSDTTSALFNGYVLTHPPGPGTLQVPTPYQSEDLFTPYIWFDAGPITTPILSVNGGLPIGAAVAQVVPFTVSGIEPDDSGTVSFSDGSHAPVVVAIVNGQVPATVDLSGLNDGAVTATLHLNPDASGNIFTDVIANATLDQDAGEQAALRLTVNGGLPIGAAVAQAVPFTVSGIEPDDSGTVSFSDGSHAPVVVAIVNGQVPATVDLSGLNGGAITATLHLIPDPSGNIFTDVIANATLATLDQDGLAETPIVTAPSTLTVKAGGSTPLGVIIRAVDSDDVMSVTISGVPAFESVSAVGVTPTVTKKGTTFTYRFDALPASDWNNGLILTSTYQGKGRPVNTLTISVTNTTTGESSTAPAKTITVTDPPTGNASENLALAAATDIFGASATSNSGGVSNDIAGGTKVALLGQYLASSFTDLGSGHPIFPTDRDQPVQVSAPSQDQSLLAQSSVVGR
jgi:hypothetical protein